MEESHKTFSLDVLLTPESEPRTKEKTLKSDDLASTDAFFLDEASLFPRYVMEIMDRTRDVSSLATYLKNTHSIHKVNSSFGSLGIVDLNEL